MGNDPGPHGDAALLGGVARPNPESVSPYWYKRLYWSQFEIPNYKKNKIINKLKIYLMTILINFVIEKHMEHFF